MDSTTLIDYQKLLEELKKYSFLIRYSPLSDEINPDLIPFITQSANTILTPRDKKDSPIDFAKEIVSTHPNEQGYLLIPGKKFDWRGTRHGRGGGWYDRLLAHLPKNYLRIGVAKYEQISKEPLNRNPWDEPMDWLVYFDTSTWKVKRLPKRAV